MDEWLSPPRVFAVIFSLSSFTGLAVKIESKQKLTVRNIAAAILTSGVIGLMVGFMWYRNYSGDQTNVYFLIGVCMLAGSGGASHLELATAIRNRLLSPSIGNSNGNGP